MRKARVTITLFGWALVASGIGLGDVRAQNTRSVPPPELISQWQGRVIGSGVNRTAQLPSMRPTGSSSPGSRIVPSGMGPVQPGNRGPAQSPVVKARPDSTGSPRVSAPSMTTAWRIWESETPEEAVTEGHPVLLDPFGDSSGLQTGETPCDSCVGCNSEQCQSCGELGSECGIPALEPEWFGPPWAWPWWYGGPLAAILNRTEIFIGAQGFKGSPDLGRNGNFGFHEGFNFGAPLGDPWGMGWQFGFRAAHADFAGSNITGVYDPGSRNQFFLTTGLFHRKFECGLQWAVVFDYLHDNYYASADLQQLRTEISWKFGCQDEVGFWGAFSMGDDRYSYQSGSQAVLRDVESRDLYAVFYRRALGCTGESRIYGGFSGHGNGLLGADFLLPVGDRLALEAGFAYLTPKDATSERGLREETWAVTMSLIWYPVRGNTCAFADPFRPVLPVADNRYLIQRLP